MRSRETQRLVQEFQTMLEYYGNASRNQGLESRFVQTVELSLHAMSKNFRDLGIEGCPDGQEECPDGKGCVPRGRTCPDSRR
jgi:hypothetical protein